MKKIVINSMSLGKELFLSPEHWYSNEVAKDTIHGIALSEIVNVVKKGSKPKVEKSLILDTSAADKGLLQVASFLFGSNKISKSHKKVVEEGVVIVSRLRSYLMQVTYIPYGVKDKLDIDSIFCSTEFYILEPKKHGDNIAFLVPWLLSESVQKVFSDATVGGHHPRFSDTLLMSLKVSDQYMDNKNRLNDTVISCINTSLDSQLQMKAMVSLCR